MRGGAERQRSRIWNGSTGDNRRIDMAGKRPNILCKADFNAGVFSGVIEPGLVLYTVARVLSWRSRSTSQALAASSHPKFLFLGPNSRPARFNRFGELAVARERLTAPPRMLKF